jgi:beta-glucosidase
MKNKSLQDIPPYQNPDLPAEERTADLLSRMTLHEKAAQMTGIWNQKADKLVDQAGNFDIEKARASFGDGSPGQVGRPGDAGGGKNAREMAILTNAIQKFFIEESRLGIPVIFHEECLHGLAERGATSFPQPIGLAGTFNPLLIQSVYEATAEEARVRGAHQALTPVVDVARDARWGRVEETFGEDPYLVAGMGLAAVRGFQGDATFNNKKHVIATLKHFAAHGEPESGMNCGPVNVSERLLREIFLYPFREAIQKGGAISVMASYNEIDGVPSHANKWLLRDVLRGEWGFKGYVVSDYYAIWELGYRPDTHGHFVAAGPKEAAALAINAGVNIELPEPDCYRNIVELVEEGTLKESQIDELVRPMLLWKFKMGIFDDPYVNPDEAERISGSRKNSELALTAARETITLLKNQDNILPLDINSLNTIAVIGPNANRSLLGGYSGVPAHDITVIDGIKAFVGDRAEVLYSEGCKITVGGSWNQDEVIPGDPVEDKLLIENAVLVAQKADVIILAIGGNEQTSREAWMLNHMGDRANIDMVGRQDDLVRAMVETGKPVVVFLFNGRPLSINYVSEHVPCIFECWYLGQEMGHAVADVLFGNYNPGGKLPVTIPRSAGHLPAYYNHKPSARRGYLFDEVSPLYPFGFGLSYTSFSISNIRLEKDTISRGESVRVLGEIKNTGNCKGSEVVQMYIRDMVSSVTRPVKELKGFEKIWLEPGETKTVSLEITSESLAFFDINMEFIVEPGDFEIMVGNSSRDADLTKVVLHVK